MSPHAVTRWDSQYGRPVAAMEYGGRTRAGCEACRKKKLKCDENLPSCTRCEKSGEACIRGFTHRSYNDSTEFSGFAKDQIWINVRAKNFISENNSTASLYNVVTSPGAKSPNRKQQAAGQMIAPSRSLPRLPELDSVSWPLTDRGECDLFQNYEENLAVWLDLCDPEKHFQTDVPKRAATSKILLNAIFALSARHLSRTRIYDPLASNRYHQECLDVLIPMLRDNTTVLDETLFAATIILRVLEEIDMPDTASTGHLTGIKHFVNNRDPYATGRGLSEASFWVGLRQEIYFALTNHEPIEMNLTHPFGSLGNASGYTWANRAVVFCADVMNFCFSEGGISHSRWAELDEYSKQWPAEANFIPTRHSRPRQSDNGLFPAIVYPHGYQIIGIQHHYLGRMLLAIYDPCIPRFGPNRKMAVRNMEARVKVLLRELCGIGLHNSSTAPAMFTTCMGIAICGDMFDDRKEQEALIEILLQTEKEHARPTAAIQKQLRDAWEWTS